MKKRDNSLRNYDRIWVVFDKDDFPDNNFNGAIIKAKENDINCAWTNEAFELWYLLHFEFVNTALKRTAYKAFLEKQIRKNNGYENYKYIKKDPKTFSILESIGNQNQAIKWARKLQLVYIDERHASHNPCPLIHELIDELKNPEKVLEKLESK